MTMRTPHPGLPYCGHFCRLALRIRARAKIRSGRPRGGKDPRWRGARRRFATVFASSRAFPTRRRRSASGTLGAAAAGQARWTGTLDATRYRSACPQVARYAAGASRATQRGLSLPQCHGGTAVRENHRPAARSSSGFTAAPLSADRARSIPSIRHGESRRCRRRLAQLSAGRIRLHAAPRRSARITMAAPFSSRISAPRCDG